MLAVIGGFGIAIYDGVFVLYIMWSSEARLLYGETLKFRISSSLIREASSLT